SADVRSTQKIATQAEIKDAERIQKLAAAANDNFKAGKYDDAIANYQELLKANPKNAAIVYSIGTMYQAKQDWANAIKYYTDATNMDPSKKEWKDLLAAAKTNQAAPVFDAAFKLQNSQDFKGAITKYEEGLQQLPDNAGGWTNLAICYQS